MRNGTIDQEELGVHSIEDPLPQAYLQKICDTFARSTGIQIIVGRLTMRRALLAAIAALAFTACTADPADTGDFAPDLPDARTRIDEVLRVLSVDLVPRSWEHTDNLDEAADWIADVMRLTAEEVRLQEYTVHDITYTNVIGRYGPDTDEVVVVGAHYDNYGPYPGADDNTSGVAGLLTLADALGDADLERRVELVAYTLEEPPFFAGPNMGSEVHAASLEDGGDVVIGMICMDMIGYFSDEPGSQLYPSGMPPIFGDVGDFLFVVGRPDQGAFLWPLVDGLDDHSEVPVHGVATDYEGSDFSDHRNYWSRDWNAVLITDTASYRNTAYHTANDTMDRLDIDRMAMLIPAFEEVVVDLANGEL